MADKMTWTENFLEYQIQLGISWLHFTLRGSSLSIFLALTSYLGSFCPVVPLFSCHVVCNTVLYLAARYRKRSILYRNSTLLFWTCFSCDNSQMLSIIMFPPHLIDNVINHKSFLYWIVEAELFCNIYVNIFQWFVHHPWHLNIR